MLRRSVVGFVVLLALLMVETDAHAQEAPTLRIDLPDAGADAAEANAIANESCTEEPLEPGIQFTWGGRVVENDPEGSTNVQATVEISGVAEFVPGTQTATRGTWTTFTTTEGVLDIGTTSGGEEIDFSFDIKSNGAGTATWTFSASDEGGVRGTVTCDFIFGESSPAGLSGLKWNDANGNGQRDDGEEGLQGWTIELDNGQSTTTNADGAYSFPDLEPGPYTVSEVQQSGWTQTFPGQGGSHTVTLESGDFAEGLNFGNQATGADLTMDIEGPGEPVAAGEEVPWTITVENQGPEDALGAGFNLNVDVGQIIERDSDLTVCDPPTPTQQIGCAIGNIIPPGDVRTYTFVTRVEETPSETQTLAGEVGADTEDPVPGNNSDENAVTVEQQNEADVAVEGMDTGLPIVGGLYVTEATVINQGPDPAGQVELTVDFPIDVLQVYTIETASDDDDTTCATDTNDGTETVTCIMNDIQPDEERAVFVTSRVMVAEEGAEVEVTGSTQTDDDTNDPNDENDTFLINRLTTETPPTDLEVTKSGNSEAVQGDTLWYFILVDNIGANPAEAVQMLDTPFMVGTPASNVEVLVDEVMVDPGGSCVLGFLGLGIRCDLGTLAPGDNVVIWVPVIPSKTGTLRNRVQAFSRTTEANLLNNEGVVETEVLPEGQLVVEKTVQSGFEFVSRADFTPAFESVSTGDSLDFFIDVVNTSSEVAQNVIIEDELPAGFQPGSHSESCSTTLNVVRCEVGDLEPGNGTFVRVAAVPQEAGDFVNTATVASDNVPGSDDTAEVRVVDPQATIAATAEPDEQTADLGAEGSVTFTFDNVSESDVLITPSFRAEAGVDFSSIAASEGLCEDIEPSKNGETALRCVAVVDSSGSTQVDLGFEATTPGTHRVRVDVGTFFDAAISTVTVEDTVSVSLCGQKFVDFDADGERDDDEPGLDGVTIELLDESGTLIASEASGTEDRDEDGAIDPFEEKGRFCFDNLSPGTYTVREVTPLAFTQTFPAAPGTHTVELTGEAEPPLVLFGNTPVLDPPPEDVPLDYGDLPDPRADVTCPIANACYRTLLVNSGPRHTIDPEGPHLGATVDADPNGQPDATATGDDAFDGSDDEDGLINHSIQADGSIQFEIEATVPAGATAYVNAWVDLDDDGLLDSIGPGAPPPPEHVLVRQPVVNGGNTLTTAPGLVDSEDQLGFTRIRISSTGVAFPSGPALDGEVEDYVLLGADFGDAPGAVDPDRPGFPGGYPTTLAQDGARHVASFNTRLGDHIDADDQVDGAFDAREDDDDQPQDDEDGIRFLDGFTEETDPEAGAHVGVVPGTTAEVLPLPSVDGKLDAWIDWNRDGDWEDAGEQIVASEDIGPQMTEDDALTLAVPEDAAPGFTYARFRFSRLGGLAPAGAAPSGEVEDYLIRTADVLNVSVQMSFGDASGFQDYRLVALPGAIDLPLAQTLSGDPGVQWQAFWDDGSDTDFLVSFDGSETFTFRPGRGFWLISTAPWTVEAAVKTVPLEGDSAAAVPLHAGWNILSNPLDRDVPWSLIEATNKGELQALWVWDGRFTPADTLRSAAGGEAFYFLNHQGLDRLLIPYPSAFPVRGGSPGKATFEAPLPRVTLHARHHDGAEASVQVGLAPDARDGLDGRDQFAPPSHFEALSLHLLAPGAAPSGRLRYLAREWRPPDPAGQTFDVVLRSRPNEPIQLEAAGVAAVVGQEVVLIDSRTGRVHDLQAASSVSARPVRDTSAFKLVMGTEAFVERERARVLPDAVALQPGYPNPFRDRATLTYALPERSEVRLAVYDVLGRRVRLLVDAQQPAGRHRIQWDGRNAAGQPVASGLYLIHLEAGGQRQVQKMTLVR